MKESQFVKSVCENLQNNEVNNGKFYNLTYNSGCQTNNLFIPRSNFSFSKKQLLL